LFLGFWPEAWIEKRVRARTYGEGAVAWKRSGNACGGEWISQETIAVPAGYRDWRSLASLAIDVVSSEHSKPAYQKPLKARRHPRKEICTLSCVFKGLPERTNFEM